VTTGLVLQELQRGFPGLRNRAQILDRFAALPLLVPDRRDHVEAAELRNKCRRGGIQAGTIEALLAQLCVHHDLTMLTSDRDFRNIARQCTLRLWTAPA
jgi:predicted nucleic acid-binding protein